MDMLCRHIVVVRAGIISCECAAIFATLGGDAALVDGHERLMECAVCHGRGIGCQSYAQISPIGIYTIPEMSMVGETEESLTKAHVLYALGIARYAEISHTG